MQSCGCASRSNPHVRGGAEVQDKCGTCLCVPICGLQHPQIIGYGGQGCIEMPFAAGTGGGGLELVAIEGPIVKVRITGITADVNP